MTFICSLASLSPSYPLSPQTDLTFSFPLSLLFHTDLAGAENKAHAEFLVGGGNEQENKVLLQWFKAFAESQLAISEARLIYVRNNTFPSGVSKQ